MNNIIEFYGRQSIEKSVYDSLIHYVSNQCELQKAKEEVHEIVDKIIIEFYKRLLKESKKDSEIENAYTNGYNCGYTQALSDFQE